jgi:hypothetical protein
VYVEEAIKALTTTFAITMLADSDEVARAANGNATTVCLDAGRRRLRTPLETLQGGSSNTGIQARCILGSGEDCSPLAYLRRYPGLERRSRRR